ncbi:MAG: ABC transporter permease [Pyrinomonadaceae bacterium]
MKLIETLKLALAAIWAHKLRSALTLLGMVIGVTAVVVVVSMIQGFNAYVDEKIANIGAKSFSVYRFNFFTDFKNTDVLAAARRRNKELTLDDYEYLRARATLVDKFGVRVAPSQREVKNHRETLQGVPIFGASANTADITKTESR